MLPEFIEVGYIKYRTRPYIPSPLRCFNCLHFGHILADCKISKKCSNCGENFHLENEGDKCILPMKCVNCNEEHHAFSNKCPKFQKEKEVQKIKVIEKVDMREANKLYRERFPLHQTTRPSFSNTLKSNLTMATTKCICGCVTHTKLPALTTQENIKTTAISKIEKNSLPVIPLIFAKEKNISQMQK